MASPALYMNIASELIGLVINYMAISTELVIMLLFSAFKEQCFWGNKKFILPCSFKFE